MPDISRKKLYFVCGLALGAFALALGGCVSASRPGAGGPGQHAAHFQAVIAKPVASQYLLYLPQDYRPNGAKRYPLLIFLHGSGESGSDLEKVKAHGPPQFLANRADFPFIVASPQATSAAAGFDLDALNALLDELLRRLPVDPDRVYLTGLSMGGYASYYWAGERPERFAAVVPISGAGDPIDACRLKNVPIWSFHGALDDAVKLSDDQAFVDAVKACGGNIRFTVYPDVGHWAWDPAYADPQLYEWLLAHRRGDR